MFDMIRNIWVYVTNVFHRDTPLPETFLKKVAENNKRSLSRKLTS